MTFDSECEDELQTTGEIQSASAPQIDLCKEYKTRHGYEVRLFDIIEDEKAAGRESVFGVWKDSDGEWMAAKWFADGRFVKRSDNHYLDLVEVKPLHTVWVNIYDDGEYSVLHSSKEQADCEASPSRIACIQITFREGDGL